MRRALATTTAAAASRRAALPAASWSQQQQQQLLRPSLFGSSAAAAPWRRQQQQQLTTTASAAASDAVAATTTTTGAEEERRDGRPRVCVLGGGFGGLYAAIKLELLMWPRGRKPHVTLIDQGERFVFKPLLYELLNGTAGPHEVAPTFAQLLAPYPIRLVRDSVVAVAPSDGAEGASSGSSGSSGSGSSESAAPPGGRVELASGAAIEYDYLVVALGAAVDARGVPGAREHARPFSTLEDAEFVAGRLAAFEARAAAAAAAADPGASAAPPATVAVVGAGYAGVELASVVAERLRGRARVVVLTPGAGVLQGAPRGQRAAAEAALRRLDVEVLSGAKVASIEKVATAAAAAAEGGSGEDGAAAADASSTAALGAAAAGADEAQQQRLEQQQQQQQRPPYIINLEGSGGSGSSQQQQLAADLVLWTAGSRPASQPLAPFPTDARGQLETEPTLRVVGHPRVFALGDVSRAVAAAGAAAADDDGAGAALPATAQVAFQQADYAAWNVWAAVNNRPLLPFRYQHLGSMMSLGAANAAVALPLSLPPELARSVAAGPLGGLLSAAGIRLGAPADSGSSSSAAAAAASSGGGVDSPAAVTLEGPLAQLLRRAAYLYRQPTNEQRLSVAAAWVQQAADAAAALAAEAGATTARSGGEGSASSSSSR